VKVILRGYGIRQDTATRQAARAQAADMVRTRGTGRVPGLPRDVFLQPGPRGILVNWLPPAGQSSDIVGWRIYKDDETKLFADLKDASTTQHFIEATAGTTPPVTNIFVSSVSNLGESPKVQAQSAAIAETGAPTMPVTPPTYTTPYTRIVVGGGGSGARRL
jgi:hypothetical protein